jgi:hypothetical protein
MDEFDSSTPGKKSKSNRKPPFESLGRLKNSISKFFHCREQKELYARRL